MDKNEIGIVSSFFSNSKDFNKRSLDYLILTWRYCLYNSWTSRIALFLLSFLISETIANFVQSFYFNHWVGRIVFFLAFLCLTILPYYRLGPKYSNEARVFMIRLTNGEMAAIFQDSEGNAQLVPGIYGTTLVRDCEKKIIPFTVLKKMSDDMYTYSYGKWRFSLWIKQFYKADQVDPTIAFIELYHPPLDPAAFLIKQLDKLAEVHGLNDESEFLDVNKFSADIVSETMKNQIACTGLEIAVAVVETDHLLEHLSKLLNNKPA